MFAKGGGVVIGGKDEIQEGGGGFEGDEGGVHGCYW